MVTGPEHPWLVAAYAESVPHPFGSVIGQEFFELGLIPSDTDFRIFRDFGQIPGIHQSPLLLFEKKKQSSLILSLIYVYIVSGIFSTLCQSFYRKLINI